MISKLIAVLTSQATKDEIIERVKGNPRSSFLAAIVVGCWGAAASLYDKGFVVGASLCAGAGGLVAVVGLLLAFDKPKDPPQ